MIGLYLLSFCYFFSGCFCSSSLLFYSFMLFLVAWKFSLCYVRVLFPLCCIFFSFVITTGFIYINIYQFSSVTQLCLTLWSSMGCSTPGLPAHHQLLEPAQTHVCWVYDDMQPSYPLSSPSPPAFNFSQHQGLFQWVSSSHQVVRVLELQLQHQSFQWIFKSDFL